MSTFFLGRVPIEALLVSLFFQHAKKLASFGHTPASTTCQDLRSVEATCRAAEADASQLRRKLEEAEEESVAALSKERERLQAR